MFRELFQKYLGLKRPTVANLLTLLPLIRCSLPSVLLKPPIPPPPSAFAPLVFYFPKKWE